MMSKHDFRDIKNILLFAGIIFPVFLGAQVVGVNLDLGRYYYRADALDMGVIEYDENEHCGMFPNGSYYMWTVSNIKERMLYGKIILAQGEEQTHYEKDMDTGYYFESPFGIWEISKYLPPEVYVDDVLSTPVYEGLVDESIKADKMFRVFCKRSPWMHVLREGYQFVNQYYGDFTIIKTTYKFTFDDDDDPVIATDLDADTTQVIEDVYLLKLYRVGQTSHTGKARSDPNGDWFVHHGAWWTSTMGHETPSHVPSIVPGCARDRLIVTYGWDGDHPQQQTFSDGDAIFDDTGEPRWTPVPDGNLTSTPYSGFALLHCDESPTEKSDWVENQPYTSRVNLSYRHERGEGEWPGNRKTWDYFIPDGPGIYETSPVETDPKSDPTAIEGKQPAQVWGGWPELRMGDSLTVVHVIGSGSISREEARAVGYAWSQWYLKGDTATAYYDDPVSGHVLVTDEVKNRIVARGRDSLIVAMQRAQELWENDLVCPRPYPSPDLYVNSAPYAIVLEWTDVEQEYPGHEGGNVTAYRIYRKVGHFWDDYPTEAGKNLSWKLIDEIPVGELTINEKLLFEYTDQGLAVGEDYHYAVTAVSDVRAGISVADSGPYLESSRWSNRSSLPASPFVPGKSYLDSVVVVPNPYYIFGQRMNFLSDNNRLMFANLPPFCTLRIYNVTGDLIHTIIHDSGTSTEFWDQITTYNQYIASGVYILAVTDAEKLEADESGALTQEELPGQAIVKFTIIR